MSKIDIIVEKLRSAPPEIVDEVIALIDKLQRTGAKVEQPARRISDLIGTLKDSKAFAGDPVEIQRAMRDEWD